MVKIIIKIPKPLGLPVELCHYFYIGHTPFGWEYFVSTGTVYVAVLCIYDHTNFIWCLVHEQYNASVEWAESLHSIGKTQLVVRGHKI